MIIGTLHKAVVTLDRKLRRTCRAVHRRRL